MEPKFDLPITSSPVPSSSFSQLTSVSSGQAEDLDRRCRERFEKYVPINAQDDVVRLLTAFIDHLPKDGSVRLMQDIIALDGDSKLRQLRNHLVDAVLKPIQASGGKTPAPTPSACGNNQEQIIESLAVLTPMNPSSRNEQSKLKKDCLKRDGYRCQATGLWDDQSVESGHIIPDDHKASTTTEIAHILPFALGKFDGDKDIENKARIWQCLYRYFPGLHKVLSPETINTPANAITLDQYIHHQFGSLNVTFKETDDAHVYEIIKHNQTNHIAFSFLPSNGLIALRCEDNSVLMPSPFLLSVHARIGKILKVSGLKDRLEKIMYTLFLPSEVDPSGSTDLGTIVSNKLLILTDV
ncbi:hypothetical protein TESG_02097 [Trichophyton tonsurans CBS 112818]|uniref:HNH nuclease domain-containing protein n=1 Tax=Trichophyton tonsurans (strain CBS 112818) TaxID=647933 RepID=F2RTD8_TRIT1|nr:hypothetical protein TESG_02097 [Trichophyton tonsurans CBS 112818]